MSRKPPDSQLNTSRTATRHSAGTSDLALFARILRQARSYWLHIFGLFLLGLLATPLALLTPVPLKIAVDSVLGTDPLPSVLQPLVPAVLKSTELGLLIFAALLVIVNSLLAHVRGLANSLLRSYTAEKLVLDFRARLFRHAQQLSLAYHDSVGTSDSIYRIQYDTNAVQYVAIDGVIPFLTAGFTLVGMFWVTASLDLQLALVALAVSPLLATYTVIYRRRVRPRYKQLKRLESSGLSVVQEVLTSLRVVKAFGQEEREHQRFVRHYERGLVARLQLMLAEGGLSMLTGLTTAAATGTILFLGVRHVQTGVLTLGGLLLVMSYLGQLYSPIKTIGKKVASLQNHLASAERAFSLLDRIPDVVERPNAQRIKRARGEIVFEDVSFHYPKGPLVLKQVSIEIPAGTRVGIAGKTGAGKSTLVSLATRFYDPWSGVIRLDGRDLSDYRLSDLRDQFGIVLQESVLLSTTIAENIAYAKPGARLDEIRAAAKAANADEFITSLKDGYDTKVGERGLSLSGGERQRIALARAFLKDAPILILDEPTSSVDVGTEAVIVDAMTRLMKDRTTLLIAHRLTTLRDCDLLIILEDGRLRHVTREVSRVIDAALRPDLGQDAGGFLGSPLLSSDLIQRQS
jgi:ATP-binding cassette subfamily B protein